MVAALATRAAPGLALIPGALLGLRADDVFPAWNAIAACLGAALILWAGCGEGRLPAVKTYLPGITPARPHSPGGLCQRRGQAFY
jgi:hypothetical protein